MSNKIALEALTEDQWLDLAERHASKDWDCAEPGGYLRAVKALCEDFAAIAALEAGGWLPMDSAPKDGTVILGFCRHDADPYYVGDRLTDYGARCEGLGHVADGMHAICWEAAREESDGWEHPSYWIPAGWTHNADNEQMDNPTHWMPLLTPPKD